MLRYDPQRVSEVLMRLSSLLDPLALFGWIAKKTKYGDRPGPSAWHYTELFLADYGIADKLDQVVHAFDLVGIQDEVNAGVWLAENEGHIA